MQVRTHTIRAEGILATLDLDLGQVAALTVEEKGRHISPWARVPWADDPPDCATIRDAPHLARMSCDFFCAPFSTSDVDAAPPHGWSANSEWDLLSETPHANGTEATFRLRRKIMGATVEKRWRLIHHSPFLYQSHTFLGGFGHVSVAHHTMVDMRRGGMLRLSARRFAETPSTPLESDPEKGYSLLAYPARSQDLTRFPTHDGLQVDLTRYPLAAKHEDFVMLVDDADASGPSLSWTLALRPTLNDAAILIKDAHELPQTMLWYSNGGRQYTPWNGRHIGVLGIEDACAYSLDGHAASIHPNAVAASGVPTCIALNPTGKVTIRHAIGALELDPQLGLVEKLSIQDHAVRLIGQDCEGSPILFWRDHFRACTKSRSID